MRSAFPVGSRPLFCAWLLVIVFCAVCIVFPLVCVALTPGLADVASVVTAHRWHVAMRNTALECVCSTGLSVLIGYVYAYAVVRGGIPCARVFAAVPVVHLVTPPFVGGLAFILLVGRQGFLTKTLLGLDVSLYGFWGLLLAQVLTFFPIAYLMCAQVLRGMNPALEQAARGMGAGGAKVFFSVTLPLSVPGILGALLFIAVSVLSDFGNPLIVAGRFRVLAVEIYTQLNGWLNAGTSAVLGLVLLVPSVVLFLLQNKVAAASAPRTATIGGKTLRDPSARAPSVPMRVALTVFCALIALAVAAQFLSIIAGSFQTLWGVNTAPTLAHLQKMRRWLPAVQNTLAMASVAALCSTGLATVAAYLVHRTAVPFRRALDAACQLPAAVPGSLFGLALSLAANTLHVRHAPLLILIAMTVGFLPFSYRLLSAAYAQVRTTLDDGAVSLGAGKLRVLATVLVPLSAEGLFTSFIYDFVRGVGTVSAVIFLISFNTPLASVTILNLAEQGDWGQAAALALILTLASFCVLGAVRAALTLCKKLRGRKR